MNKPFKLMMALLMITFYAGLSGCKGDEGHDPEPDETVGAKRSTDEVNDVWHVAKSNHSLMFADPQLVDAHGNHSTGEYVEGEEFTKYFTDAFGRTVYIFINDLKDMNNFTTPDFLNNGRWHIFHVELEDLPSGMGASEFGELQLTYRGWPVYDFGQETRRGDNKGVSVPSPGVGPVVNTELPATTES